MTNYEDIRGTLPYKESPVYIEGLIDRCKEGAVRAASVAPAPVIRPWMYGIAAALIAGIVLGIALGVLANRITGLIWKAADKRSKAASA